MNKFSLLGGGYTWLSSGGEFGNWLKEKPAYTMDAAENPAVPQSML